ncbi:organic cation transporter protein-like [Cydia amplana]|uniref:organic cation transporter protein-like n=1 Tax=Cydia amplana TaxID=1869771 RepID=UPI002FE5C52F
MVQRVSDPEKSVPEDTFSQLLGHFGKWQLIIFLSVFLIKFASGWVQMAILFLTPKVTYWCEEFPENFTGVIANGSCYKDCVKYGYDTSPMDSTIVSEWDLVCDRAWMASFTQMMLQFGILTGSIVYGFLSDRYGRRITFLASICGLVLFSFCIPFSTSYIVFTVFRFFLGFSTAGTMVISFVIVMEAVGPKYREAFGCVFHIPFILGHLTIPVFAYFFRTWESYTLALAVPQVVYLSYFLFVTESPRWLVSVGRVDEATEIVKKAAIMNKMPTDKIEETLKKVSHELVTREAPKVHYGDLFRPNLWVRTVCSCALWVITGVTFYGVNQYISQTSSSLYISIAAAAVIQLPANLLSIWCVRTFGRKATTIAAFTLGGLCLLTLGVVGDHFWLKFTLGTLGVSFLAIDATTIYIYSSELFPTVVRNMGLGLCSVGMRFGSMLAPFISNLAVTTPWLPTVIFGFAPLLGAVICLLLPETKGKKLPDSFEDVES